MSIILYGCPECDAIHVVGEWNDETTIHYGGDIETIQKSELRHEIYNDFVCPSCGDTIMLIDIKKIPISLDTNSDATVLLKRWWEDDEKNT